MIIRGEKIILKPITKEHTPLIVRWRNNLNVRKNFIYQEIFTEEGHNNWLTNKVETGEVVQYIIYIIENEMPIGSVYLRDIDKKNERAEFGIFIGEDVQRGKGYGTEAVKLMCKYGFDNLNLHKLMLRVFAFNEAAIRAYERAGFEREAYLRDEVKIDGTFYDMIFMAMIKDKDAERVGEK